MNLTADRESIAAALSTATDVTGHPFRPVKLRAGDAWPLLGEMERGPGRSFTVSWRVLVFLPQDGPGASEWVDAHVEHIVDALEDVGFVDRIAPITIQDGDADRYALQFIMRSE